jgi:hypothetical protein
MNFKLIDTLPCGVKIKFLSSQVGTVFFYKDTAISTNERWFFVIGYEDQTFYLAMPQSNVEGRLTARGETREKLRTLVIANNCDYPELSKESIIDCNTIHEMSHDRMIDICEKYKFEIRTPYSDALRHKISVSIKNSDLVSEKTKGVIKNCNNFS